MIDYLNWAGRAIAIFLVIRWVWKVDNRIQSLETEVRLLKMGP